MLVLPKFELTGIPELDDALVQALSTLSYALAWVYQLYYRLSTNYEEIYKLLVALVCVYVAVKSLISMVKFFARWSMLAIKGALLTYGAALAISFFTGDPVDDGPIMSEARQIVNQALVVSQMAKTSFLRLLASLQGEYYLA